MTLVPVVVRSATWVWVWAELAVCLSIPFFFSGVVVSLALTRSPFPIGTVYGVDLLGAAAGCLGVLLLLNYTDGPSAVLWVGAIAAAGAIFFAGSAVGSAPAAKLPLDFLLKRRYIIFVALVVCATINGITDYGLQPLAVKGSFEGGNSFLFRRWNSFSRVTLMWWGTRAPFMYGPSPAKRLDGLAVEQRLVSIDGDAGTVSYRFNGSLKDAEFLKYDVTNLAYHLPDRKRAAIIGVGSGRDVLSAAVFGLRDITGIEINPIIVNLLTREPIITEFSTISALEGTKFVIDEGRSWFARTKDSFDIIQMSLIDTWAATGAGAFTLSENGLYTVEAWRIFVSRLTPEGVFSVSRWYDPRSPNETGRMLSLAVAALMNNGVAEPQRHIFLAAQGLVATLLLSRTPFSERDLELLANTTAAYKYDVLLSPTVKSSSETLQNIVTAAGPKELTRYTSSLPFDLTPSTDDRPFFFNQLPLHKPLQALRYARHMIGHDAKYGGVREGNLVATATITILFAVAVGLVGATIVIPLRSAIKDVGGRLVTGGTLYFLLIGIGFMMVEIGLLQRMSIFLGHPMYSLSILLFTLILTTGMGSICSEKFKLNSRKRFSLWAVGTGVYIITLPLWLPNVLLDFDSTTLLTRAGLCILSIAPAGFLMGFGFPTGMRLVSSIDRRPTPWFWGINGAAGVLASIAAVACSIALGISTTLTVGAVCYLLLMPVALMCMHFSEDHSQ